METSSIVNSDSSSLNSLPSGQSNGVTNPRIQFPSIRFLRSPISTLLEHAGIIRVRPEYPQSELVPENPNIQRSDGSLDGTADSGGNSNGEVSIRIIGSGDQDRIGAENDGMSVNNGQPSGSGLGSDAEEGNGGINDGNGNRSGSGSDNDNSDRETSTYQRYDIQQVARWVEQILPFSLLLLVVFIRQHLQGFFVTIWITAILFKSNDILRKQTALKAERRISVLVGYSVFFMLHVCGIYWWYRKDDLFYPLFMVPPKTIPPFWHAVFMVLVNDTMVRQSVMVLKLVLLMYYKNGRGHNFRRQGQMLTLVEYTLLLYRALLPTPVWYRFFLNKDYGSLFSLLTTGLYLTFKLTSVVEKAQSFFSALKALSRKDVNYGTYATLEQVNAAGDLCAICQEKMHAPILLRCKHIFCEDCVSEWFERERTCPLCRALVRPADLRSYGDGSTSLLFQLF